VHSHSSMLPGRPCTHRRTARGAALDGRQWEVARRERASFKKSLQKSSSSRGFTEQGRGGGGIVVRTCGVGLEVKRRQWEVARRERASFKKSLQKSSSSRGLTEQGRGGGGLVVGTFGVGLEV